ITSWFLSAPAATAGAGGAGVAPAVDGAGPEPAATMASSTLSETPAFLRPTSASVFRSNLVEVYLILAMTTASARPALTIWSTESLVSTSWASEVAPGSDRLTAATRMRIRTTRVIFMRPPGQRETVGTGRAHPGGRGDRPPT